MPSLYMRLGLGIFCCLLLSNAGCNGKKTSLNQQTDAEKRKSAHDAFADLPGTVTGTGWHIHWRSRANETATAIAEPVLEADAQSGAMADTADKNNITAQLFRVRARLYRNGIHTADVEAPEATANQQTRIVIGTGRVTVRSLTNPPDTVVTADQITWNANTNGIVAEGNAVVTRRPPTGLAILQRGNRIIFDSRLNTFQVD